MPATGAEGAAIEVTASVCADPLPQPFDGTTCIVPDVPTVAVTELMVPPAVCVHPEGNVQL